MSAVKRVVLAASNVLGAIFDALGKRFREYRKMMRFNSEWRKREGAEAIFQQTNTLALVRIHSIEEEVHEMHFCVDRVPWPSLPFSPSWQIRDSFRLRESLDYLAVKRDHWVGSPYAGWIVILDPEAIQKFKAIALKLENASEEDRCEQFREFLIAWYNRRLVLETSRRKPGF